MEISLTLEYRGVETLVSKSKNTTFYKYYFENEKGISQSFVSAVAYSFEKGKSYNLLFNIKDMYFKGVVNGK